MWWPCSTGEGQAADVWQHGRLWQGLGCCCCQAGDRLAAWQGVAWGLGSCCCGSQLLLSDRGHAAAAWRHDVMQMA